MKQSIVALTLALGMVPIGALAQATNTNASAIPTDAQRQAMHQTFERYAQQEKQLYQQMRWQILSTLSPVHRRAVAATIGELAIAPDPDTRAAAKRLDATLSPSERQRILAAHETFKTQSRQLHEQMRSELQSEMPPGHSSVMNGQSGTASHHPELDAGGILLMALVPHPMMEMMMHGMVPHGMSPEGPPPQ